MGRQDQYLITAQVDGRSLGVWDTFSGGEVDSEETKHRGGGMGPQVSLGGPQSVGNVTIGKLFPRTLEASDEVHWLMSRAGKGNATVTKQPLDRDGNRWGRPFVYTGTLKSVSPGDTDSESADKDMYEMEISTVGSVG